ncbi:MAG: FAD-binding domain-containing protein [Flammeovirgaceae bacterium]
MASTVPPFPTSYELVSDRIDKIDPIAYARTRNYIDGDVTYLAPYISRGVISAKQVLEGVRSNGYQIKDIEKFVQELAWREYFQRVWQAKGNHLFEDLKQPQPAVLHQKMIAALQNGNTGIEAIDQQIQQLYQTGYMHNHARMYVASVACNTGKAHWLVPARWMYYHLLDGDWASNACSWQWVAGTFSSKQYYANQENINRYLHSTQRNTFLDVDYEWLPRMPIPAALEGTSDIAWHTELPSTPIPSLDPKLPTLIYNSYNLDPQWRAGEQVNRVLLLEPSHFKKYPISGQVLQFILGLSENIPGIQCFTGEVAHLTNLVSPDSIISKEHPAFDHYPGAKDERDWLFPNVTGYFLSFSSFWKRVRDQSF